MARDESCGNGEDGLPRLLENLEDCNMTTPRMSVITDWRTTDAALPDLTFGEDYERVVTPQKSVVLHRIIVQGRFLRLRSLRIGALSDVPFELENENAHDIFHYRPKSLDQEPIKQQLINIGAAAVGPNAVALPPGMDIWLVLRNDGVVPSKPRVALIIQEET
jgi:hypothetical protein